MGLFIQAGVLFKLFCIPISTIPIYILLHHQHVEHFMNFIIFFAPQTLLEWEENIENESLEQTRHAAHLRSSAYLYFDFLFATLSFTSHTFANSVCMQPTNKKRGGTQERRDRIGADHHNKHFRARRLSTFPHAESSRWWKLVGAKCWCWA